MKLKITILFIVVLSHRLFSQDDKFQISTSFGCNLEVGQLQNGVNAFVGQNEVNILAPTDNSKSYYIKACEGKSALLKTDYTLTPSFTNYMQALPQTTPVVTSTARVANARIDYTPSAVVPTSISSKSAWKYPTLDFSKVRVGSIKGVAGASSTGAATYTIPIDLPTGPNGIKPNLSIAYNSHLSASGSLGWAWDLQGMSAITRTPQNFFHDGAVRAVDLSSNDKFALDGNRLVAVTGNYGANNTDYYTENTNYQSTIKSIIKNNGTYPDYFLVKSNNGAVTEYGNTTNSLIVPDGSTIPYAWNINKYKDEFGNEINYEFLNDKGFSRINKITYGYGKGAVTITFAYTDKTDKLQINLADNNGKNVAINQNKLVDNITITVDGNMYGRYKFTYLFEDGRSKLGSIAFTDADNKTLNPTNIYWNGLTADVTKEMYHAFGDNTFIHAADKVFWGKLDAGKIPDAIIETDTYFQTQLGYTSSNGNFNYSNAKLMKINTSSSSTRPVDIVNGDTYEDAYEGNFYKKLQLIDIDTDGKDEILLVKEHKKTIDDYIYYYFWDYNQWADFSQNTYHNAENITKIYKRNLSNFTNEEAGLIATINKTDANIQFILGDFDGNGIKDFLVFDGKTLIYKEGLSIALNTNLPNDLSDLSVVDMNGDGKTELLAYNKANGERKVYIYNVTTALFETSNTSVNLNDKTLGGTNSIKPIIGDFNGDNKTDLINYSETPYKTAESNSGVTEYTDYRFRFKVTLNAEEKIGGGYNQRAPFDRYIKFRVFSKFEGKVQKNWQNYIYKGNVGTGLSLLNYPADYLPIIITKDNFDYSDFDLRFKKAVIPGYDSKNPINSSTAWNNYVVDSYDRAKDTYVPLYVEKSNYNSLFPSANGRALPDNETLVNVYDDGYKPIVYINGFRFAREDIHYEVDKSWQDGAFTGYHNETKKWFGYSIYYSNGSALYENSKINSSSYINSEDKPNKSGFFTAYENVDIWNKDFTFPEVYTNVNNINAFIAESNSNISGDFNGDGKTDLFKLIKNSQNSFVLSYAINNGAGFDIKNTDWKKNTNWDLNMDGIMGNTLNVYDYDQDGNQDIIIYDNFNQAFWVFYYDKDGKSKFVKEITDGYNRTTAFDIQTNIKGEHYIESTTPVAFPVKKINYPLNLVKSIAQPDGNGGTATTYYQYEDGLVHLQGKGFLGFLKTATQNTLTSSSTTNELRKDYNYSLMPINAEVDGLSTTTFKNLTKRYNTTAKVFFNYLSETETDDKIKGFKSKQTFKYDFEASSTDLYGKIVKQVVSNADGSTTVANDYDSNLGGDRRLLTKQTVTKTVGSNSVVSTASYTYDATSGYVKTKKTNEDYKQYLLETYTYNAKSPTNIGQIDLDVVDNIGTAASTKTYTTKLEYDPSNRFVTKKTNTIGSGVSKSDYITNTEYNMVLGVPTKVTLPNGEIVDYDYDGLGRLISQTNHNNKIDLVTNTEYQWASFPNLYKVIVTPPAGMGSPVTTTYDILEREIKKQTEIFKNDATATATLASSKSYNGLYQVASEIAPHFSTDADVDFQITYGYTSDGTNRVASVSNKNNSSAYTYNNLKSSISYSPTNRSDEYNYNQLGLLTSVTKNGGTVSYSDFTGDGNPREITANGKTTEIGYDEWGRKSSIKDPSSGTITYKYDGLGNIVYQKDARGKEIYFKYDDLNRLISKTVDGVVFTYTYEETAGINKGKLVSVEKDGVSKESYNYDPKTGYLSSTVLDITSTKMGKNTLLTNSYTYLKDGSGRIDTRTYPNNLVLKYIYHSTTGQLIEIQNASTLKTVYALKEADARGNVTKALFGNSIKQTNNYSTDGILTQKLLDLPAKTQLVYDIDIDKYTGNVNSRTNFYDVVGNKVVESFQYTDASGTVDNFDRLHGIDNTKWITYDANGNITQKYDAGSYSYTNTNPNPYAVAEIKSATTDIPHQDQVITYTATSKVESIDENNITQTFVYGTDDQRLTMTDKSGNQMVYAGDYEFMLDNKGAVLQAWTYITGLDGHVAAIDYVNNTSNGGIATGFYYAHTDHLGSVRAVSNSSAVMVESYDFDAWGRRTNTPTGAMLRRGFTFHEHLDDFGLINMNGRLYDPIVGRMLSPDNFVQEADNNQSFNRYTYAFNNPLKNSDPSGNITGSDIVAGISIIGGAILYGAGYQELGSSLIQGGLNHFVYTADAMQSMGVSWDEASNGTGISYSGSFTVGFGQYDRAVQVPQDMYSGSAEQNYDRVALTESQYIAHQNMKFAEENKLTAQNGGGVSGALEKLDEWIVSKKGNSSVNTGWEEFYDKSSSNGLAKGPNFLINYIGLASSFIGGGAAVMSIKSGMSLLKLSLSVVDVAVNTSGAISSINGITGNFNAKSQSYFYNNTVSDVGIGLTGVWNSRYNGFGSFKGNNSLTIGLNLFSIGLINIQNYK